MLAITQSSVSFIEKKQQIEQLAQMPLDKMEQQIFYLENNFTKILSMFEPRVKLKGTPDEFCEKLCKIVFTPREQERIFGKKFVKKVCVFRVDITADANKTQEDIDNLKDKINAAEQLLKDKKDNWEAQQDLVHYTKELEQITEAKKYFEKHNTTIKEVFEDKPTAIDKQYIKDNLLTIAINLLQEKGFQYLFSKSPYSIYELIDWDNIDNEANFDKQKVIKAISIFIQEGQENFNKVAHCLYYRPEYEGWIYNTFIKLYCSSSYNSAKEKYNTIGSLQNVGGQITIKWKLDDYLYKISPFVMFKSKHALVNEEASWDRISFEEEVKQWGIKQKILIENLSGLRKWLEKNK